MGQFKVFPILLIAALSIGCAESPTATNSGAVFITVSSPIDAGSLANAQLVNQSGSAVRIGAIGCSLGMDQLRSMVWSPVPREDDLCPQPNFTVGSGKSYPFDFTAPASAGTFRIHTFVEGDAVYSKQFVVR